MACHWEISGSGNVQDSDGSPKRTYILYVLHYGARLSMYCVSMRVHMEFVKVPHCLCSHELEIVRHFNHHITKPGFAPPPPPNLGVPLPPAVEVTTAMSHSVCSVVLNTGWGATFSFKYTETGKCLINCWLPHTLS